MNFKRPVYRKCAVSKEILLKKDLFRICKINGNIIFDKEHNLGGRGAYIKKDLRTIELAYKTKAINKALRSEVNEDIYLSLIQELSKERRG